MAASSALRLILGSSSASRRQILAEMGYSFTLLSADIDEKEIRKEKPEELVVALAHAKADAIMEKLRNNGMMKEILDSKETTLLITADQVYFHKIPDEVVESLIEEGNVFYVAGGLLVEHPLTSPLVEAIVGTIDSVMGLPKALTEKLIKESLQEP
uniref:Maf-like protein n=1 Tax=Leersia perrieri TaxID=77586 RepID=A0A0D9VRJ5_9ORYZ